MTVGMDYCVLNFWVWLNKQPSIYTFKPPRIFIINEEVFLWKIVKN
jgi:hypothetical protein